MRRWQGLVLGVLAGLVVGCASNQPIRVTSWLDRWRQCGGPTGSDVVQMDVALLERPVGDNYINQELWAVADEQVIALEHKAVLEDNGFRVAQVGGLTPAGLQALLTSDRSCVNPRRIQLRSGSPTTVVLGPSAAQCQFRLPQEETANPITLDQAQCALAVVPTLTGDGRVRLQFTPQVQHGEAKVGFRPAADQSGWLLQEQRPTERYPNAGWEVTLAANEYVVIGACYDRQQTLGHQCFIRPDEPTPVQRLLVIRTGRQGAPPDGPATAASETTSPFRSPPLAYQAAYTAVRGTSH